MEWFVDGAQQGAMTRLRHEVVAYLGRHALDADALDEAEIVVSEAVGNAVRHASGPVWVSLTWPDVNPRLTVRDAGPGFEPGALARARRTPTPEDGEHGDDPLDLGEGGRGFFLMSRLAESVQVANREETGALVSVLLPVERAPSRRSARTWVGRWRPSTARRTTSSAGCHPSSSATATSG